jgi:hypothetical protein
MLKRQFDRPVLQYFNRSLLYGPVVGVSQMLFNFFRPHSDSDIADPAFGQKLKEFSHCQSSLYASNAF